MRGRTVLVAAGCALACAVPAGAATNGRIAFTSFRDGGVGRIHTMATDGSDQRAISAGPDAQSDFSPDGGSIAFRRGTTGAYEVWVMGAGGEAPRQLTDTPGTANSTQPSWLPDGSGLLFRRGSSRATDIWRMAPDGSGQAAVVTVADDQWYPSASPATGRILFATTVTSRDRKIQDAAPDGSGVRTLRDVPGGYDSAPAYSPDGRRIAFESDADGDMEIYVMDADGGDVQQITRNTVHDEGDLLARRDADRLHPRAGQRRRRHLDDERRRQRRAAAHDLAGPRRVTRLAAAARPDTHAEPDPDLDPDADPDPDRDPDADADADPDLDGHCHTDRRDTECRPADAACAVRTRGAAAQFGGQHSVGGEVEP